MHFPAPADAANLGFDESVVTEDPKWPWYEWVKGNHPEYAEAARAMCWHWPNYPHHPEFDAARESRAQMMKARAEETGWRMMGSSPLPSEVHDTTWITSMSIDFIERHVREHGRGVEDAEEALYNLASDRHEDTDVKLENADVFGELKACVVREHRDYTPVPCPLFYDPPAGPR